MYPTDLNNKIVEFINRAQTKLGELSTFVSGKISKGSPLATYQAQSRLGFELDCFVRALDNNWNSWTNKEIETYIELWNAKANLNQVPYFTHTSYNLNIRYQ
jgi:hypothetical protein